MSNRDNFCWYIKTDSETSHDIAKDTPLLGLFHTFEGGVSLASEVFLRAPPSGNLKYTPKSAPAAGYSSIPPVGTKYKS